MWAQVVRWVGHTSQSDRNFLLRTVALVSPLWRDLVMASVRTMTVRVPDALFLLADDDDREDAEDISDADRINVFIGALRSVSQLCTGLEELRLDGCGLGFEDRITLLADLPLRPTFRRLSLENLRIVDEHFNHVDASLMRGLEALRVSFCSGLVDFLSIIGAKLSQRNEPKDENEEGSTEKSENERKRARNNESDETPPPKKNGETTGAGMNAKEGEYGALQSERLKESEELAEALLLESEAKRMAEKGGAKTELLKDDYRLRELVLIHCPLLASLKHLPLRVERLSLQSCYRLRDTQMCHIARLPHLKFLLLSVNRLVTDVGLAALPLESLDEFHFHYWGIGVSRAGLREATRRSKNLCLSSTCPIIRDEP